MPQHSAKRPVARVRWELEEYTLVLVILPPSRHGTAGPRCIHPEFWRRLPPRPHRDACGSIPPCAAAAPWASDARRGPECPCTKWCRIPRGRHRRWCGCARNAPPFPPLRRGCHSRKSRPAAMHAPLSAPHISRIPPTPPPNDDARRSAVFFSQPCVLRKRKQHRLRTVVALEKIPLLRAPHALSSESLLHNQGKAAPAAFLQTQLRVLDAAPAAVRSFRAAGNGSPSRSQGSGQDRPGLRCGFFHRRRRAPALRRRASRAAQDGSRRAGRRFSTRRHACAAARSEARRPRGRIHAVPSGAAAPARPSKTRQAGSRWACPRGSSTRRTAAPCGSNKAGSAPWRSRAGGRAAGIRCGSPPAVPVPPCCALPIYRPSIAYDAAEYHREAASHSEISVLYCF